MSKVTLSVGGAWDLESSSSDFSIVSKLFSMAGPPNKDRKSTRLNSSH